MSYEMGSKCKEYGVDHLINLDNLKHLCTSLPALDFPQATYWKVLLNFSCVHLGEGFKKY